MNLRDALRKKWEVPSCGALSRLDHVQHLVSSRVQQYRVVKRSGWHENLQNLLTRTAISEEPLSDLQERMEDFTSYRATALPQSDLTLGKLELLH